MAECTVRWRRGKAGAAWLVMLLAVAGSLAAGGPSPASERTVAPTFAGQGAPTVPEGQAQGGGAGIAPSQPILSPDKGQKLLRPDLTVDAVGPQGQFGLSIFTHNNGSADAGPFSIVIHCEYWMDKNFKQDCGFPKIPVSGLARGTTDTRRLPLNLFHKGNQYSLSVRVDADSQVTELNETNNVAFKAFFVP